MNDPLSTFWTLWRLLPNPQNLQFPVKRWAFPSFLSSPESRNYQRHHKWKHLVGSQYLLTLVLHELWPSRKSWTQHSICLPISPLLNPWFLNTWVTSSETLIFSLCKRALVPPSSSKFCGGSLFYFVDHLVTRNKNTPTPWYLGICSQRLLPQSINLSSLISF